MIIPALDVLEAAQENFLGHTPFHPAARPRFSLDFKQ